MNQVGEGDDYRVEAQLHTLDGPRWFALDVRRSRDPITANMNILYSAQDITSVVQAKKEADQANSVKDEFFAIMVSFACVCRFPLSTDGVPASIYLFTNTFCSLLSLKAHEIRTPLHQVNGFVELLSKTNLTKQQSEYVNLMDTSSVSMMCVINDLLDYTKLSSGQMELESFPFDPRDVAAGALAVIAPKITEKGLKLRSNLDTVQLPSSVLGDPNRLRQLLLNYLSNGVKFTEDGEITLEVCNIVEANAQDSCDGSVMLEFAVSDTGIGISPEHMQIIFEKYKQAGACIARQYGGTGLGLAICKSLVETMGGTIGVDSQVGHGARFWFRIPFGTPSQEHQSVSSEPVKDPSDCMRRLHVLVAEDNKVNQKLASAMLKRLGHQVTVVEDGMQAVEAVLTVRPRMISY